jgi:hypothetical protein
MEFMTDENNTFSEKPTQTSPTNPTPTTNPTKAFIVRNRPDESNENNVPDENDVL